jgi:hypothetical protein
MDCSAAARRSFFSGRSPLSVTAEALTIGAK